MTMTSYEMKPPKMTREDTLLLSDDEKRLYFKNVRLAHPRIAQTLDEMATLTEPNSGKGIVLLIGPTGVGKSTLVSALGERVVAAKQEEMEADPGSIPVAMMVAPASGERGFSWKMFYTRLGEALNEPLMDRKLATHHEGEFTTVSLPGGRGSVSGMRMAIEKIMAIRKTRLIVIDEAVPMLRQARGNDLANHMDAIKTLSDMGATLVLVGSYDLHQLAGLSAQVARRTAIVHFRRYLTGVETDEHDFRTAIRKLQEKMPLRGMPDLTERADLLHVACLGCVGILKTVLSTAFEGALRSKGKWSDKHLERALLSEDLYETILSETLLGEDKVKGSTLGSGSFKSLVAMAEATNAKIKAVA